MQSHHEPVNVPLFRLIVRYGGLQFGLQFTAFREGSSEYTHAV
jgi:hypothetical protein